jgi:predicted transcriptional regulator
MEKKRVDIESYLNYIKYLSDSIEVSFSSIEKIQNIDFNMNCDFEDIKTKTNEMSYLVEDLMEKIEEFKEVVSISHFRDGKISRLGI